MKSLRTPSTVQGFQLALLAFAFAMFWIGVVFGVFVALVVTGP